MATKFNTGKVRFSYPNVFKPRASAEGAEPKVFDDRASPEERQSDPRQAVCGLQGDLRREQGQGSGVLQSEL